MRPYIHTDIYIYIYIYVYIHIHMAVSLDWGALLVGVLKMRALLFGVYPRAAEFWKGTQKEFVLPI